MKLSPQAVGLAVRAARESAGLSLSDLSGMVGVSTSGLSRLENGLRGMDFLESVRVCEAVGIDLNAIQLLAASIERGGSSAKFAARSRLQKDLDELQRKAVEAAIATGVMQASK